MNINDLTAEQLEKAKACASASELVELAKDEGVELADEDLERIAGGRNWDGSTTYYSLVCYSCNTRYEWEAEKGQPKFCPNCGASTISV